jgi:hypothetical protein
MDPMSRPADPALLGRVPHWPREIDVRDILRKALSWAVEMPPESAEAEPIARGDDAAAELLRLSSAELKPAATVGTGRRGRICRRL